MSGPGTTPTSRRASIKVRAALAGGLVFGIGAGLTVASWTDAEKVYTDMGTSRFAVQIDTGSGFVDAASVPVSATGVFPTTAGAVYVPVYVRTSPTLPSAAGGVQLSVAALPATGLSPVLRYRVAGSTRAGGCGSGQFTGSPSWIVGGAATYQAVTTGAGPTTSRALAASGADEVGYCIEFTVTDAAASSNMGLSSVVTFTFTGTS
jgi:hypothetical protein